VAGLVGFGSGLLWIGHGAVRVRARRFRVWSGLFRDTSLSWAEISSLERGVVVECAADLLRCVGIVFGLLTLGLLVLAEVVS
jgi:hypothetical protein